MNVAVALLTALVVLPPMLVWADKRGWVSKGMLDHKVEPFIEVPDHKVGAHPKHRRGQPGIHEVPAPAPGGGSGYAGTDGKGWPPDPGAPSA